MGVSHCTEHETAEIALEAHVIELNGELLSAGLCSKIAFEVSWYTPTSRSLGFSDAEP